MRKLFQILYIFSSTCAFATDIEKEFKEYCKKFNKSFANEKEREYRFNIFKDNFKTVEKSNNKMSGLFGELKPG